MKRLALSADFSFPLSLVTEAVAILAMRRAGKSNTAKRIVEELHGAGQQFVVMDPKGDWWGLRSSADGKAAGLPVVVLGGEHGDVPLEPESGELVAKLVVEQGASVVLDLGSMRKHQRAHFAADFLEALYRLKNKDKYRTPLMLVVDEADAIAPQKTMKGGNEERMLGAAEDIVRRGGQRGLGIVLVSQRAAVLNKNVLTQCGVLILLRTTGSQDIDAVDAWIEKHGQEAERQEVLASIASMPRGDAWIWAPGWPTERGIFERITVPRCRTFDSGATPKPGETMKKPKTVADVDLDAFRKEMAATIERAKAEDPVALKKELVALRKSHELVDRKVDGLTVANRALSARIKGKAQKVTIAGATAAELDRVARVAKDHAEIVAGIGGNAIKEMQRIVKDAAEAAEKLGGIAESIRERQKAAPFIPLQTESTFGTDEPRADEHRVHFTQHREAFAVGVFADRPRDPNYVPVDIETVTLPRDNRPVRARLLGALAELRALGIEAPERVQVAFLAGYAHPRSKGFTNALGEVHTAGLVEYPTGGTVSLSEAGRQQVGRSAAPSLRELHDRILSLLAPVAGRLLRTLLVNHPTAILREDLATDAGYEHVRSKGFTNALGSLSGLGLIRYPAAGSVAVNASILFPPGVS